MINSDYRGEEGEVMTEAKKIIYIVFKDEGFPYEPNLVEKKRFTGENAKNLAYRYLKKQGKKKHLFSIEEREVD